MFPPIFFRYWLSARIIPSVPLSSDLPNRKCGILQVKRSLLPEGKHNKTINRIVIAVFHFFYKKRSKRRTCTPGSRGYHESNIEIAPFLNLPHYYLFFILKNLLPDIPVCTDTMQVFNMDSDLLLS